MGEDFHSILLLDEGEGWLEGEDLLRRPYLFAPNIQLSCASQALFLMIRSDTLSFPLSLLACVLIVLLQIVLNWFVPRIASNLGRIHRPENFAMSRQLTPLFHHSHSQVSTYVQPSSFSCQHTNAIISEVSQFCTCSITSMSFTSHGLQASLLQFCIVGLVCESFLPRLLDPSPLRSLRTHYQLFHICQTLHVPADVAVASETVTFKCRFN